MEIRIKKYIAAALVATGMCAVFAQSAARDTANIADASADGSRQKREQAAVPERIKKIFALADKSAEDDFNVNFCGFFVGMSRYDALELAAYYRLKEGEYSFYTEGPGMAVYGLWFSLNGVRRITKGGNTIDELAQAVADQVGDMKWNYGKDDRELEWERTTLVS